MDISVIFVPAALVKNAALEAIDAGVKFLVLVPDRVPIFDVLEVSHFAKEKGASFVGPNTLGLVSPGKAVLGMIGGRAETAREWFRPGNVGVSSRSGGMTSAISYYLTEAGLGQSTIIHVGGDAVVGLSHPEVVERFEQDDETEMVVLFGEIGTTQEERASDRLYRGEGCQIRHPVFPCRRDRRRHSGFLRQQGKKIKRGRCPCRRFCICHTSSGLKTQKRGSLMSDLHWKTSITKIEPNKVSIRGYPVDKLMGNISFAQAIYLVLTGEMPSPEVGKLVDAIFVSSVDHGASPPSVLSARTVASTGSALNAAIASGVLAISRYHGGAIEEGMKLFRTIADGMEKEQKSEQETARIVLMEMRNKGKRASGFGHRIHSQDPRTQKLFDLAKDLKIAGKHIQIARAVEKELASTLGKSLPINVDGAIAAVLCELGISPEIGNAFFIIARVPGLVAHIHEEWTRMRPMRKIHPQDYAYDGPDEREL
jgi:citrate synthase